MKNVTKKTTSKAPIKLELLVVIVNRAKADFYVDYLQQYEVNMSMIAYGDGTAKSEIINVLGLKDTRRAVIFSMIKKERLKRALEGVEEKFATIRNGKGIAFTIPLTSIIGVAIYNFLCNNNMKKEEK